MKSKYLPIFFVLSSFLLFACSLTNVLSNNTDQDGENLFEPNLPTEIVETAPAIEIELTQPPQEPTEALDEPQPELAESVPQIETVSLCYHPYFPIVDNAYWTFQETAGEGYTLSVIETGLETFTLTQEMFNEDVTFTVEWFCSENGILNGSFSQVDLLDEGTNVEDMPEMVFETFEWEGETLPAPDLIEIGYRWTSNYSMSADVNFEGIPQTFESYVVIEHEIGAIEEVTVPAGTFENAVRVDSLGVIDMVVVSGESTFPLSGFNFTYSTWYVEGVGMVKSSDDYAGFSNMVELIDYGIKD